jgi:quinolinate synthase
MSKETLILAHYYAPIAVQRMAHHVGDSLELATIAQKEKADRIVFAGVRFMAETAKVLNPESEVILPDWNSTCSLVEQTDTSELRRWRESYLDHVHVMYINSSVEQKALADWIVTSRNVEPIIAHIRSQGHEVMFSPDRNMGVYLNRKNRLEMPVWSAVCEVHDQFDRNRMVERYASIEEGKRFLISHPESPIGILDMSDHISSTKGMLKWVEDFDGPEGSVIFVATEMELVRIMREMRSELSIWQVPVVAGCRCNECPYMKLNTLNKVKDAINGIGTKIDYISESQMERVRIPIKRMMDFKL